MSGHELEARDESSNSSESEADSEGKEAPESTVAKPMPRKERGTVSSSNLDAVHARYGHVLRIMRKNEAMPLSTALREANLARNTVRDFLGLAELRILDERRYEATIQRVRREVAKPSVRDFEKACRDEVAEKYFEELGQKKSTKTLLPLMTQKSFYENKLCE